jgi:hypothetical protein
MLAARPEVDSQLYSCICNLFLRIVICSPSIRSRSPSLGILSLHDGTCSLCLGILSLHDGTRSPSVGILSLHDGIRSSSVGILSLHEGTRSPYLPNKNRICIVSLGGRQLPGLQLTVGRFAKVGDSKVQSLVKGTKFG